MSQESGGPPIWNAPVDPDITLDLPPNPRLGQERNLTRWLAVGLVLLSLVIAIPGVLLTRGGGSTTTAPGALPPGCEVQGSPCQVAQAFLTAYTTGKYADTYQYVSQAAITRFSAPAILRSNYKDAKEYIVNRTQALLGEAEVYAVTARVGGQTVTARNTATVSVHVVMETIRTGEIAQDLKLPFVNEKGRWLLDWSPGVVFKSLDDPADPRYQRLLHLFLYDAPRGKILDRDGHALAEDETVKVIGIVPGEIKNEAAMLQTLGNDLDYTADQLKGVYQNRNATEFVQIRMVTLATWQRISNDVTPFIGMGVQVQDGTARVYPYGSDTAAVTGYVAPVSDQDLINDTAHYYEPTDVVGRDGIEGWADLRLRPVKGGELDIVPLNADGSYGDPAYTLGRRVPAAGADVHTAINLTLQQKAMADMRAQNHTSGTVAMDPSTGEVLVLASNPIYDPNDFSLGFTPNEAARQGALDHPYLNRAVAGTYPIGSVGKVTMLAAAMEAGIPDSQIWNCPGSYTIPGTSTPRIDDVPTGHGSITDIRALAVSCDVVFWQISVNLFGKDPHLWYNMAHSLGYGERTQVTGLPDGVEATGNVTLPDSPGAAANVAIGQGDFTATPIQLASVAQGIANNGQRLQPRLVLSVVGSDGQAQVTFALKKLNDLAISPTHLTSLQAAMLGPTTAPGGTAYDDFGHFSVRVAGKTGTAEAQPAGSLPDSLFTCYAPASPVGGPPITARIAVGSIVANSGLGEQFAVPISKDLIKIVMGVNG
ncbi:MAG TPA: penicillin-binding transpeptidase domain-containing protein [Ktedonobacterales bacterium]|nr:penicillin-binding transpeptidase domain-containing protein [Ktedonobacterales bacterium]